MTNSPPANPRTARPWKPLDARQLRVLSVLIEKAKTTPAAYPMTVKYMHHPYEWLGVSNRD